MKKLNNILITVTIIFTLLYFIFNISSLDLTLILISIAIIPVLFVMKFVRNIFHLNISDRVEFVYIIFVVLAQLFGSVLKLYYLIPYYDKVVHFTSGLLSSTCAVVLLNNSKLKNRTLFTDVFFIITFALAVAGMWEIFEYTGDRILGGDAQRVITTGVHDTMTDIIAALLASISFCLYYTYPKLVKN